MKSPRPIALGGDRVRLEPLTFVHTEALFEIGMDDVLWQYLSTGPFKVVGDARIYIEKLLALQEQGLRIPFAVIDKASSSLVGSSCYLNIDEDNASLEIGSTWYAREFQRTYVNTETKYLLLGHAFEELKANRVQLLTDSRNRRSQNAIARIGATREGVLRCHKVYPSGYIRDSVIFSIIMREWPERKALLREMISSYE